MIESERFARIRVSLKEIEPEIWRRLDVPLGMSLKGLHDTIQAAMAWQDCHLFEFRIGNRIYGIPEPLEDGDRKVLDAKLVKLETLVANDVTELDYVYDFGDDWDHLVTIESVGPAEPGLELPRFIDGARRAPPEDCGGPYGYADFVEAITRKRHPRHRELTEWYGGPFDPESFDQAAIRRRLGGIAKRRQAGRLSAARRRSKG
jgi:hypothetical protein